MKKIKDDTEEDEIEEIEVKEDDRWLPREYKAERDLKKVLVGILPETVAEKVFDAIREYVEAKFDDLDDKVNQRGRWDPDW